MPAQALIATALLHILAGVISTVLADVAEEETFRGEVALWPDTDWSTS